MDLGAHLVFQERIDETLGLDGRQPLEAIGHDGGAEVPAAAPGAGMTSVQVALVDHFDKGGLEAFPQLRLDAVLAEAAAAVGSCVCAVAAVATSAAEDGREPGSAARLLLAKCEGLSEAVQRLATALPRWPG